MNINPPHFKDSILDSSFGLEKLKSSRASSMSGCRERKSVFVDYYNFIVQFEIGKSPALLFFLKIASAIQGLLWFHTKFKVIFPVKNAIGILIGIELNLQIALGSVDILTILPIRGMEYLSIFLISSSISFINVLQFSMYRSFTSMAKYIPRYFILLDVFVNGFVS